MNEDALRPTGRELSAVRWWFENRRTGDLTVAQFPNWPLFAIGALWLIRRGSADASTLGSVASLAIVGLWIFWGAQEVVRGVNPFRKLLGALVIGWQAMALIT